MKQKIDRNSFILRENLTKTSNKNAQEMTKHNSRRQVVTITGVFGYTTTTKIYDDKQLEDNNSFDPIKSYFSK